MMSDTHNTYIHPKDFIETAIAISTNGVVVGGAELIWLVDFNLQVAALITPSAYEEKDWLGCTSITQKFFLDFLAAQQSKIQKKSQTLHDFLHEGVKLTPIYENQDCNSFTVGFLVNDLAHLVSPKIFTIESEVAELFYELAKNIPGQREAVIQPEQIKLDPDYIEMQHNPDAMCQYEATLEFNRVPINLKVSSCGVSEKEAIKNLHRNFCQIIKLVTIQP